jgi:hypothetical protein
MAQYPLSIEQTSASLTRGAQSHVLAIQAVLDVTSHTDTCPLLAGGTTVQDSLCLCFSLTPAHSLTMSTHHYKVLCNCHFQTVARVVMGLQAPTVYSISGP